MQYIAQTIWDWFSARAHTRHAQAWLFFLSFSESSFFIVPPEVLLIPMLAADGARWLWYSLYTTGASIAGAIFGYVLAYFFFDLVGQRIVDFYHLGEEFAHVGELFNNNAFWVMFTAAFTPIPFKVFVLAAGFFKINFIAFLFASILGRGLRYGIISYLAKRFGAHLTEVCLRYANLLTAIVVVVILAGVLWFLLH